ncbi:MAG TPA: hypothetical protein VGJ93_15940 [Desulfuromonadaceae bacterium]|jgi:hypothetical protein
MKNIKAIIGIVLIFTLGAASGAIVTHMIERAKMESFIKGGPDTREETIVSRLTKKLDLDNQQQVQVKTIIHENHLAMRQIRKQCRPQIEAILEQGQARIKAVLKPEQQEKFRVLIEERKQRHQPEGP